MAELQRAAETYFEVVENKAVIVDPSGAELLTLNEVGTIVWQVIDGRHDDDALVDELAARFPDVPRPTLEGDVRTFLAELERANLVERR